MRWEVIPEDESRPFTANINEFLTAHFIKKRSDGFWLFKLGDPNTGWIPDQQELDYFRNLVASMYTGHCVFYHWGVSVEYIRQPGFLTRLWRKIF
jgi:hypothetical protein